LRTTGSRACERPGAVRTGRGIRRGVVAVLLANHGFAGLRTPGPGIDAENPASTAPGLTREPVALARCATISFLTHRLPPAGDFPVGYAHSPRRGRPPLNSREPE